VSRLLGAGGRGAARFGRSVRSEELVDPAKQFLLGARVVHVSEQFRQRPQRQDIDVEVVFGLDPVTFGGAVLTQQDQRRRVGGLGGEQEVQQDERPAQRDSAQSNVICTSLVMRSVSQGPPTDESGRNDDA